MTTEAPSRDRATEPERLWVVVTELRDETCAFAADVVLEVFPLERWTPVPGSPPFVIGVVARKGAAYGVLDVGLLREALSGGHWSSGRVEAGREPLGGQTTGLLLRTPAGGLVVSAREVVGLVAAERVAAEQSTTPDVLAPSFVTAAGSALRLYDASQLETLGRAELRAVALSART
ncbi:MAG: chemotaxis protein CheW [Deltaproteobacteria bacterium]|nr:chemotaxis protein CheW [Deltaproteobacteria bacterium]